MDCGRSKMLFPDEGKARRFIKFNGEEINSIEKLRVYYCETCGGYHISSHNPPKQTGAEKARSTYESIGGDIKNLRYRLAYKFYSSSKKYQRNELMDLLRNDLMKYGLNKKDRDAIWGIYLSL